MKRSILALTTALMLIGSANAEVVTNVSVDTPFTVPIPCTGDTLQMSGPLHIVISTTVNDNTATVHMHFQPQGISGVDTTTGVKYNATGVTDNWTKVSLQNGQGSQTIINNFRMIGQGNAPNFDVHETGRVNINADGTVTVSFDDLRITCQ